MLPATYPEAGWKGAGLGNWVKSNSEKEERTKKIKNLNMVRIGLSYAFFTLYFLPILTHARLFCHYGLYMEKKKT
jgi:hypothetical protein